MTSTNVRAAAAAAFCAALLLAGAAAPAPVPAQTASPAASVMPAASPVPSPSSSPALPSCLQQGKPLLTPPVIRSTVIPGGSYLRATLRVSDGTRTLWGSDGDNRCATQTVRYFSGSPAGASRAWPAGPDPIPGPTFRAKLGDLVEITFFNEVNPKNYPTSLDRGTIGTMEACDPFTMGHMGKGSSTSSAGGDTMPDCLHGSSTTNVHFHGTHTTPNTTGDNILLFVRPALRDAKNNVSPSETETHTLLQPFFASCEVRRPTAHNTWPNKWGDLPPKWVARQASLIHQYDTTTTYNNGQHLPPGMQLGTVNQHEIAQGLWPQYQLGANPYCFPLPKYDPATMHMGQSPGTHWYHAHKHGSTALNVANGMTGVFIIEGPYDTQLHQYYHNNGLREQVMMIQQLSTAPFPLTDPRFNVGGPGAPRPRISVNGRLNPMVTMQPGEVQMWRVVNGGFRDAIQFAYFTPASTASPSPATDPCAAASPAPSPGPSTVQWRQIAQDGVQLNVANYRTFGARNRQFNLSAANRADLLVKAPTPPGWYTLCVIRNIGTALQGSAPFTLEPPGPASALLTVNVPNQAPVKPAMDFIPDASFPTFPAFLSDIKNSEIKRHRTITFASNHKWIDGKPFIDGVISQQMLLNTAEEWVVKNQATDKQHPFHIHINPFQLVELFEPNNPSQPCPIDPNDPATFDPNAPGYKPCPQRVLPAPWVWWDTFAIPAATSIDLGVKSTNPKQPYCTTLAQCPPKLRPYITCTAAGGGNPADCTENIPGWFRSRSRFVDFTGQYVLHCHILIHEDRGMMQLIEVTATTPTTNKSPYTHH